MRGYSVPEDIRREAVANLEKVGMTKTLKILEEAGYMVTATPVYQWRDKLDPEWRERKRASVAASRSTQPVKAHTRARANGKPYAVDTGHCNFSIVENIPPDGSQWVCAFVSKIKCSGTPYNQKNCPLWSGAGRIV